MSRIAEDTLEAVRRRVDIAELVREYVPELKRSGRNHKARCPFHQEKTPSFMVSEDKQIFHCFGCQEGGDAFAFLMKMDGLSFTDAVRKLAERAGVPLPSGSDALGPKERERLELREALAFAQGFYRDVLTGSPLAEAARRYLEKRGVDGAARERFTLGFAPGDGASLLEAAARRGYSQDLLVRAGLASALEGSAGARDFFRGRILFPIRDTRGDTVGFGARAMGDAEPKYLNGRDTALFSKGRILYGLFEGLSDVRKSRRVLLLEGYMDVLAAHQFGFFQACAPLGTALTHEHAEMLRKRYADEAVIVFDPDAAGSAASLRGAELLLEQGLAVRIATVPGGLDPDEFLHQRGRAAFQACLRDAQDIPEFQTASALRRLKSPLAAQDKSRVAHAVLGAIAKAPDEILKREWVRRLAQRLELDEESLCRQMRLNAKGGSPARGPRSAVLPEASAGWSERDFPAADRAMLRTLLQRPMLALDSARVQEDDFSDGRARSLFLGLRESLRASPEAAAQDGARAFLQALPGPEAAWVRARMLEQDPEGDPQAALDRMVRESRLVRRCRSLQAGMREAELAGASLDPSVAREYHDLLRRLSDLRLLDRLKA